MKSHDGMYNFILCLGQNLYSHMILKVNHFHLLPFKVKMWLTGFTLHNMKNILILPLYAVLYISYKNALETFLYMYIFSFLSFWKKKFIIGTTFLLFTTTDKILVKGWYKLIDFEDFYSGLSFEIYCANSTTWKYQANHLFP